MPSSNMAGPAANNAARTGLCRYAVGGLPLDPSVVTPGAAELGQLRRFVIIGHSCTTPLAVRHAFWLLILVLLIIMVLPHRGEFRDIGEAQEMIVNIEIIPTGAPLHPQHVVLELTCDRRREPAD